MTTRDPFLHAIMIVGDRFAVFVCLSAISAALMWILVCRITFGTSDGLPYALLLEILNGQAGRAVEVLFALTCGIAVMSTSALCYVLFQLWRRRARIRAGHLRGPLHEE